ncbi:MAG: HAD family hydrolase [Ilumatobacteraceae bacterium]
MRDLDAYLFDAGGVLVLPDPTVLVPLLAPYGGSTDIDLHIRAHYRAMAAKSAAGSGETFWDDYNLVYVDSVGVPEHDREMAAHVLDRTRTALLWRWPIAGSVAALRRLHEDGVPIGVVSNASGQIADILRRFGVCQVGPGDHTPVRVIVDSHLVGVAKPSPGIFDHALHLFDGIAPARIGYVGDSVTMDVAGARAAGLHPILLDPYDDHPGADFDRITTLAELVA